LSSFAEGGGPASVLVFAVAVARFGLSSFAEGGGPAFVLAVAPPRHSKYPSNMRDHEYFVYIIASRSRNIYIGVTNDLLVRIQQHRQGKAHSFTKKYKIHRLVYYERFQYINSAIAREKYLKHATREEKITLIEATNPTWHDLSAEYLQPFPPTL
jgi:putative endonuclease